VHDGTAAAAPHAGHQSAGDTHCGHDVQIPVRLPFLVWRFHDRLIGSRAGVVEKDVGSVEALLGGSSERRATVGGRDVAGDRKCLYAVAVRHPPCLDVEPVGAASCHDDVRTFGGEGIDNRQPDAGARTCYHRNLVP
jgi:hypothetical protein